MGPIESMYAMRPETALRGGFYMPPQGPAPETMPYRPREQPIPEPPRQQTPESVLRLLHDLGLLPGKF